MTKPSNSPQIAWLLVALGAAIALGIPQQLASDGGLRLPAWLERQPLEASIPAMAEPAEKFGLDTLRGTMTGPTAAADAKLYSRACLAVADLIEADGRRSPPVLLHVQQAWDAGVVAAWATQGNTAGRRLGDLYPQAMKLLADTFARELGATTQSLDAAKRAKCVALWRAAAWGFHTGKVL